MQIYAPKRFCLDIVSTIKSLNKKRCCSFSLEKYYYWTQNTFPISTNPQFSKTFLFYFSKIEVFLQSFQKSTLWKNKKFSFTTKIFREVNCLVSHFVKMLLSWNFCQKSVRDTLWKLQKFAFTHFWQKFRENN